MSLNQSRSDKNDPQYRKPDGAGGGRFGSASGGGLYRPFGGRGGAGPNSHLAQPTSTNRSSYKKVNYAQGGQSRPNTETVNALDFNLHNGARFVENGVSTTRAPAPAAKLADVQPQKTGRPLPRAPSSSVHKDSNLPSATAKGDGAKGFSLQFGSISPVFMNGMQVPPRTSSAPPNLDEQTHDQARHDASRTVPAVRLPSGQKQDLSKKAAGLIEKPASQETQIEPQAKTDVLVASASPPAQVQKLTAVPLTGISMPSPFQQPTPSMQFGVRVPNPQIRSQGLPTSSLQIPLQMGNHSQVQQQVFVPGLQHPLMRTHQIMHQGQNVGFNPQLATQHPHHLGNVGVNVSTQFNQQYGENFGIHRKTVKITHPDTHEELTLDGKGSRPSGSVSHHSAPAQNHPLPTYTANHPLGYYSNSYTTGPPFFAAPNTLPLTSTQLNATTQGSRFNHVVNQGQSNMSVNRPNNTLPGESGVSTDYIRNVQNVVPQTQPRSIPVTIKAAKEKVTSTSGLEKVKPSKLMNPTLETDFRKKDVEVSVQPKSGVWSLNQSAPVSASATIAATACAPLNTSPSDLAPIPSHVDAISKVTDTTAISVGDSQTQLSKKVDGQSSKVHKDLDDSSKLDTSEMPKAKMIRTSSGLTNEVSANLSHSSEGCESHIIKAAKDNCPHEDIIRETSISKDGEQERPEVLSSDNTLNGSDALEGADQVHQVKLTEKAELATFPLEASQSKAHSATSVTERENMQMNLHDVCDILVLNTSSDSLDVTKASMSDDDVKPISTNVLEGSAESESKVVDNPTPSSSSGSISGSSKASLESNKTQSRGKKLKEALQKADARGTTTDLYLAYKGPEDKKESVVASENAVEDNTEEVAANGNIEESKCEKKDEQDELDDWEDAADISTPKLELSSKSVPDEEGVTAKKYSRDFLLTISEHCKDLPEGFEIASDVANVLMCVSVGIRHSDLEYPNPRRIVDRSGGVSRPDRHGNRTMDGDRWNKQSGPFPPSQDPMMDLAYGSNVVGSQGGRGPNYGVHRNSGPQGTVHHAGGILSGPMHSLSFQRVQRNNSDADRWLRGAHFNKGLMPSPHAPAPVIHKAERKYEVGKITDEEQAKQRKLKGILNKLTPQNFERLFEQVKEVNIDNVTTLTGVIAQLFDKALTEPTFCEMYANFCQHLASELPDLSVDDEKITFRRLLLNKCQEEFERGEREEEEANNADGEGDADQSELVREEKRVKARRRMLGNIRLIGELYKKSMLTERIMHECIKKLLGQYQNPDEENIEALCKLMSTIGEMIDHLRAKEHMDAYFDIMGQLSNNMQLSSRVRFMLKDAIDLRKNKWQQRRKVEGPKKIEDVHRDAAQERQGQVSRLNRVPSMNPATRRTQPLDFGSRGSMLSSPIGPGMAFRGMPHQGRGFGGQDMRMDERNFSMPLPQRSSFDQPITLGPQGGLARGMAFRGQPSVLNSPIFDNSPSFEDPRRVAGGLNDYNSAQEHGVHSTREGHFVRNGPNRLGGSASCQEQHPGYMNSEFRSLGRNLESSKPITPPMHRKGASIPEDKSSEKAGLEEQLRDMSLAAIKEYYSAKDEKEVALCIEELNSPHFYSTVVSIWVSDSFERKDAERDSLAKLLVNLTKPCDGTFSPSQLIKGFRSVLTDLEDTVTDAPKAPEFLGRIFGKVVLENVLPLKDLGELIQQGGEEPGRLVEVGLAAEVVGSLLEMIQSEKGVSTLMEIRGSSNLRLEDFRPLHPVRCRKLDMFL